MAPDKVAHSPDAENQALHPLEAISLPNVFVYYLWASHFLNSASRREGLSNGTKNSWFV